MKLVPAAPAAPSIPDSPYTYARRTIVVSFIGTLALFGSFMVWSVVANLNAAALAPGVVVVNSNRKTIQHLEGGIVAEILVSNGDQVKEGQVLLRLDQTRIEAQVEQLRVQYYSLISNEARLIAERDERRTVTFPEELTKASNDPRIAEFIDGQKTLFSTREKAITGQFDLLRQQIAQAEQQIIGYEAQRKSQEEQLKLIEQEAAGVRELLEKGLERRPRLLALERAMSQLEGATADIVSNVARTRERISELRLQRIDLQNRRQAEVAQQLRDVQTQIADMRERLNGAEDVLRRVDIRSPIDGVVVNNRVYTVGGVVSPTQPLMEIVPVQDKLVIEARVQATDIDSVKIGMETVIHLSAFKSRLMPNISGRVVQLAADITQDPRTGESFYDAKVEADAQQLKALKDVELYPGMPAEVMIVTGERTPLDYFLAPLTSTLRRSFREE